MINLKKIKVVARKISFLMPHQEILPDLKEITKQIYPTGVEPEKMNRESPEYLLGAFEALLFLIEFLEEKTKSTKE